MGDRIDELIDEMMVDAYGEHEQLWSFRQAFEDSGRFPFRGRVVGVEVEVTGHCRGLQRWRTPRPGCGVPTIR